MVNWRILHSSIARQAWQLDVELRAPRGHHVPTEPANPPLSTPVLPSRVRQLCATRPPSTHHLVPRQVDGRVVPRAHAVRA